MADFSHNILNNVQISLGDLDTAIEALANPELFDVALEPNKPKTTKESLLNKFSISHSENIKSNKSDEIIDNSESILSDTSLSFDDEPPVSSKINIISSVGTNVNNSISETANEQDTNEECINEDTEEATEIEDDDIEIEDDDIEFEEDGIEIEDDDDIEIEDDDDIEIEDDDDIEIEDDDAEYEIDDEEFEDDEEENSKESYNAGTSEQLNNDEPEFEDEESEFEDEEEFEDEDSELEEDEPEFEEDEPAEYDLDDIEVWDNASENIKENLVTTENITESTNKSTEEQNKIAEMQDEISRMKSEMLKLKEQAEKNTSNLFDKSIKNTNNDNVDNIIDRLKESKTPDKKATNYDKYTILSPDALYKQVKIYMISLNVKEKPVEIELLNQKFGEQNIRRLIQKSYLIKIGKGVTAGK